MREIVREKTSGKEEKEKMDGERKEAASPCDAHKHSTVGSDSVNSNYKPLILTVFAPPFHRARPKSGLFMQASHPQMYIHMNSKHCLKLAVSLRCPNLFLYCTAPAQDKLKNLAPVQAGSVYPFQTIALTHKESIKRRRQ